ncbi:hypothetical protein E2C01_050021 [Portunus trituberculatus]|uniref:Uncharacterized protein n=1 Tax=Portunus trituberculatus TaxID=210409 RepID=A0A5B7G7W1_PORTR|nr:hypothetical protein [Portunus trituberculatus]
MERGTGLKGLRRVTLRQVASFNSPLQPLEIFNMSLSLEKSEALYPILLSTYTSRHQLPLCFPQAASPSLPAAAAVSLAITSSRPGCRRLFDLS